MCAFVQVESKKSPTLDVKVATECCTHMSCATAPSPHRVGTRTLYSDGLCPEHLLYMCRIHEPFLKMDKWLEPLWQMYPIPQSLYHIKLNGHVGIDLIYVEICIYVEIPIASFTYVEGPRNP